MNILFVSRHSKYSGIRVGGAETSMTLLSEKLSELGCNVFYLSQTTESQSLDSFTKNGVKHYLYDSISHKKIKNVIPGRLYKKIDKYYMRPKLHDIIKEHNIDIVYTYYLTDILSELIKVKKIFDFKLVLRMAGLLWHENIKRGKVSNTKYQYLFNQVDSINYISDGLKKMCEEKYDEHGMNIHLDNYFISDIGVQINEEKLLWSFSNRNLLKIVVATRFTSVQKRQDILIEALNSVKNTVPFEVIMIGEGSNVKNIKALINRYHLNESVKILSYMEQEELWELMSDSDLLCHPCDYEGLSKIILESMEIGLPVLASNVMPLSTYLKDGVNGYLADNKPEDWAFKLSQIYHNKDELKKTSTHSMKFIRDNYDADKNKFKYLEKFEDLIDNSINK